MASSGKKGKKTKGKTLALTDFLQETPGATPTIPIRKTNLNWADEVEDVCDQYESRPKANVVLPTAPKASRGFDEYSEKIPHQPPFIAYLSNLPYDVNEDEIADFFGELKISNMRIPKEDRPGEAPRLKGFGYVEFEDRESLVGALSITDCTLKNRRIRIEIATNLDNDRRRGGRMDSNRDRSDRSEVTSGDWRSGPRAEPSEPERSGRGGGFSRDRDSGFSRDRDSGFSRDREGGAFERDRGSWRDATDRPTFRDSERDRGFHRGDSDRGGGFREGFGDRNRFSDRDGGEKRNFGPRRNDRDEFTRGGSGGGGGGGGRDDLGSERSEPRTRPKLVLAPRTKPIEATATTEPDQDVPQEEIIPTSVPASSSSIFGNAKPVDTSIRERQIEDKLAKEYEKPVGDSSRESRRDNDRRDWGRKDEDDVKWGRRRDSPKRISPRTVSPRGSSPNLSKDSYDRRRELSDDRRGSPDRRESPDRRTGSLERTRTSPDRRRRSPDNRRYSPDRRRGSSDRRWASPERRKGSPERRRGSPDRRRASPDRRRASPDRRRGSPDRRRGSPDRRRGSPDRRKPSPERRRGSPDFRRGSPDRKRRSPDRAPSNRGPFQRKNADDKDKRGPSKNDRSVQKNDKEKHKREDKLSRDNHDREMPKIKEQDPPNFAVCNKYAFLEAEGDSD